ncbi:MAG: hypothetical protein QG602_1719, partial [Verrucomicrobiota bacterium]|nr:hypothetical protein [Verrucomicrobiota bacterium]
RHGLTGMNFTEVTESTEPCLKVERADPSALRQSRPNQRLEVKSLHP